MSHRRIGIQIQVALTLFAANFVTWAQAWLQDRLIAANSPAALELRAPPGDVCQYSTPCQTGSY